MNNTVDRARLALGAAGAALVIGAFLPWVKVSAPFGISLEVAGTDGSNDGWFTLAAGVAIIVLVVLTVPFPRRAVVAAICAVIAFAIAVNDFFDVRDRIDAAKAKSRLVQGSVGIGLWLTLAGAIAAFVLAVWLHRLDRATVVADQEGAFVEE